MQLASLDDLFSTQASRDEAQREKVQEIPLEELHPFAHHPFKVLDDDRMKDTADSIREYGVLVPAIARPRPDGGYELIAGHRRKRGCELAGLKTMPVIVRELDDDASIIIMVDSNIQRENILPSERAFAYQMKLEALERQFGRPSKENAGQVVPHFAGKRSAAIIGEQAGESYKQVQRFIRLTNLIPSLLDMVDSKKIAFNPAVELSYLTQEEQGKLVDTMESEQATLGALVLGIDFSALLYDKIRGLNLGLCLQSEASVLTGASLTISCSFLKRVLFGILPGFPCCKLFLPLLALEVCPFSHALIAMHHRVPLHLHAAHQLKLTAAALQIVLRTMHTEIGIPRQIVCQKAYAAFQCHQFSAQRQGRALRFRQRIAACVQKAPLQRPVAFQRKPHLLQVRFILCTRVCP